MDPVHDAILALAATSPLGTVLDLGCGRGQLAVALLEAGLVPSVVAVDRDAAALGQLRAAAFGLPLQTACLDLTVETPAEGADSILLIDILYQLDTEPQLALLRRAAALARRMVVIRASDPAAGWRSLLSGVLERAGSRFWPTFGPVSNPLPPLRLAAVLEESGFAVTIAACAQGTPLAGMLLVGHRREKPA